MYEGVKIRLHASLGGGHRPVHWSSRSKRNLINYVRFDM
jgi:hypothetical protein